MAETFQCPSCGAPLALSGSGETSVRCPFCNNTVIVPESLRTGEPAMESPGKVRPELESQIRALVMRGEKIAAIKLYRQEYASDLLTAKNAVEAVERGEPLAAGFPRGPVGEQSMSEVLRLMQAGQEINAIKLYRQMTGVGLKEAKDAVEALARGASLPGLEAAQPTIQVTRGAARTTLVLFLVIGLIIPLLIAGLVLFFTISSSNVTPESAAQPTALVAGSMPTIAPLPKASVTPAAASQLLSFGEEGMGPGQFDDARSIGLDAQGNIYLVEYLTGRVVVFDSQGKFLSTWMAGKAGTPTLSLAVERAGTLLLTQGGDVLRYKAQTGELVNRGKAGASGFLDDIFITPDGGLLVINSSETLWRFDAQGKATLNLPNAISQVTDNKELSLSGAVDGQGNLYLLGHFNQGVFKYSPQGKYLSRFGSNGSQPGQFQAPERIAVDGLGRVYVTDIKGVQVFDSSGRYLGLIKVEGAAFGMAVDDQNNLFVVTNKPKVYKFKVNLMP